MKLDQKLVDAAIKFLEERLPDGDWEGAAAMYTEKGRILTSTAPGEINNGASLCHETGAICEAYSLNEKITASVCVIRDQNKEIHILTPCGICQERLFYWGDEIEVAVPKSNDSTKWMVKTLKDIQPYHWYKIFKKGK